MAERIAIVTDSNSGITQGEAEKLGIFVLPMPFIIDGKNYFEDINLTQEEFYQKLGEDTDISTSQSAVGDVLALWDKLLADFDTIVHIPMSSGLSGSCGVAKVLALDYDGRVQVVNNQRISVTQKRSVFDEMRLRDEGKSAAEICKILEKTGLNASIYIMLETLKYLKKGGRVTPAAATVATVLRIKPVLQIQGEKLDAFAKCRSEKLARDTMIEAVKKDIEIRFGGENNVELCIAHTNNYEAAEEFRQQVNEAFPGHDIIVDPLSLSVSCHIGPGALALAVIQKLK